MRNQVKDVVTNPYDGEYFAALEELLTNRETKEYNSERWKGVLDH